MRAGSFAALIVVALSGCGTVVSLSDGGADLSANKLLNGEACTSATECGSGVCADGVCCDMACDGVCEACNLTGSVGTCSPIAAKTDPAHECMQAMLQMTDGGAGDGGIVVNLPDGGVGAMDTPCLPTCNGARACEFPDQTTSCGGTFCNTKIEAGAAVCDGKGYCDVQLTGCVAYVCGPDACKTQCSANSDCQDDYYCSTNSVCLPKKAVASECLAGAECQSSFCDNNVCCSTDCSLVPSGNCDSAGFAGTCKCTIPGNPACGGVCQYYYADADGDGYGNPATGVLGCSTQPNTYAGHPVTDNTDCGDDDANVHPGQASYQTGTWKSVHSPAYDWNCDGTITYQYPVRPGATCRFCSPQGHTFFGGLTCGGTSSTCAQANQSAYLDCTVSEYVPCSGSGICIPYDCCGLGCSNQGFLGVNTWAFTTGGGCSQAGTMTWCETGCSVMGGGVGQVQNFSETQGCL